MNKIQNYTPVTTRRNGRLITGVIVAAATTDDEVLWYVIRDTNGWEYEAAPRNVYVRQS